MDPTCQSAADWSRSKVQIEVCSLPNDGKIVCAYKEHDLGSGICSKGAGQQSA